MTTAPTPEPRKRKPRSDRGCVFATERDIACLTWIAEQYAARFDQVQRLLSRAPGAPMKTDLLSKGSTKDQINRWVRAGWVVYYRFLADEPGWVYVTKRGLELLGLEKTFLAKQPAATRLHHVWAVNEVRLMLETRTDLQEAGLAWVSERYLRANEEEAERAAKVEKEHHTRRPIPDATFENEKQTIAIEVELTPKKPDVLQEKLERLCNADDDTSDRVWHALYTSICFYVPDEKMQRTVERARAKLDEEDQKRVQVAIPSIALAG